MSDQNEIISTRDNGVTLYNRALDETYHSRHGAVPESQFVYIDNGLANCEKAHIRILEIGWGTGLNGILSLEFGRIKRLNIEYTSLEKFPISDQMGSTFIEKSNLLPATKALWQKMMYAQWEEWVTIEPNFVLNKQKVDVFDYEPNAGAFDMIYFDAFAPSKQPEIWDKSVLQKCFTALEPGAWLTTYCAQGQFKRNLKSIGFEVYERPGPIGKKEITVARKPLS